MGIFIYVWIVIGLLIAVISCVVAGFASDDLDDFSGFIIEAVFVAIAWPIILAIGIVILPFMWLYYLGRYLKNLSK